MVYMEKMLGLYSHIPFCEKKCDYCNFVSYCTNDEKKITYVNNLIREIQIQGAKYRECKVDTIFVGGGTPTCLPTGTLLIIFQAIYQNFNVVKDAEITVECNPNSLTVAKLSELKKAQVNRLSIGLQAYNNKTLKKIGRSHNKKQFDECYKSAKYFGFENISVDLILGLPSQRLFDVKRELKHLVKLGVKHISAYGLILEENTKLYKNIEDKKLTLPSEDLALKMYRYTKKYLEKHGIFRYEVSNFAQIGYESKHNQKYWHQQKYLGLGVVSSSFVEGKRWKNVDNLEKYAESIGQNKILTEDEEQIDKNAEIEEIIMLALRTKNGIDLQKFTDDFGIDLQKEKAKQIESMKSENLIDIKDGKLFCLDRGFEVLNQVILELI